MDSYSRVVECLLKVTYNMEKYVFLYDLCTPTFNFYENINPRKEDS